MQKNPNMARPPKKHLFLFLGLPRTPTNVNDLFIQPYTPNHKDMHWNRLKQLVSLLDFLGFWTDSDPRQANSVQKSSGKIRPETLYSDQILDFQNFVIFGKDWHRQMMKIRLNKSPKS